MTTTSAPPVGSFTLEGLKRLGPAATLPAIQHTAERASTAPLEQIAAQTSVLQGYEEETNPNNPKPSTDLLGVIGESDQGPSPNVSDSEDEYNAIPRTLTVSERRKTQNSKFSAW